MLYQNSFSYPDNSYSNDFMQESLYFTIATGSDKDGYKH